MTSKSAQNAQNAIGLDDKYTLETGRAYMTGIQALVRLPLMQRARDIQNNLNTAGYISGYRGSPLGTLDQAFMQAKAYLEPNHIVFQPGINEDLAATMIWGSQQVNLHPEHAKHDGVFSMWYGKGPGVDRSGDVFKHANAAGTSKHGGVLAIAGDDHACKSSTFPHQSEQALMAAMIPVLHPAGVQDVLDLGLYGWAMSRFSGLWTGFKVISDVVDSSASISVDSNHIQIHTPSDFEMPQGGLNIRWPDIPVEQERRLIDYRLPAVLAFARANRMDKTIFAPKTRHKLALVTTGKAYLDTRQALQILGIGEDEMNRLGLSLHKIALTWPLEPENIRRIAEHCDEILVLEEKRAFIESQIKDLLYHMPADKRPIVTGKQDHQGAPLLPERYEFSTLNVAQTLVARMNFQGMDTARFEKILQPIAESANTTEGGLILRTPYYCAGCPHNTSTVVPEGSRALAGIGCHYMGQWIKERTENFTQMGGEGVPWIAQSHFTKEGHIFANLGDGTYFHSGLLAIRACQAAQVNLTFKILYNDAVAMTGGQKVDGELSVDQIAHQVRAEGIQNIYVLSDDIQKYKHKNYRFPKNIIIRHRDRLAETQDEMRNLKGVSILIYDQTCAAEKRRRRKRGLMPDPQKRLFINERVCEGCGDCGKKSSCVALMPVETDYGRKRQIDQSNCNKDYSCLKGFCPSFITVTGAELRKPTIAGKQGGFDILDHVKSLPQPTQPVLDAPYNMLVTGVGGTGVVTIGALLAMAAHIEGKGCSTMDQTGLAQKGGAVTSHVKIAATPDDIHSVRIAPNHCDLMLGCDLIVAAGRDALATLGTGHGKALVNVDVMPTGDFTKQPDLKIPDQKMVDQIAAKIGADNVASLAATRVATALLGNAIATNLFMVGYAWQSGLIPLSKDSIYQAVELNGAAVAMNKAAFAWGQLAAHDMNAVQKLVNPSGEGQDFAYRKISETFDELVKRRVADLTAYQNADYAALYQNFVQNIRAADMKLGREDLSMAVAKYLFKLMAYKDEYEVARLYTDGVFGAQIKALFDDGAKIAFNLAPPLLARREKFTGEPKKIELGAWILPVFKIMHKMRGLRGTKFDIFGFTAERKMERALIADYKQTVENLLTRLKAENYDLAVEIATIPEHIRGFGHVKLAHLQTAKQREEELLKQFHG